MKTNSPSPVLDTYDPEWERRFYRYMAENQRILDLPLMVSITPENQAKAANARAGWLAAFHAQFKTVEDYERWTLGWFMPRSQEGRRIAWPQLDTDATTGTVDRTVKTLEKLVEYVSAAEYGLQRSTKPFGVFDAEPAKGFERRSYRVVDTWPPKSSDGTTYAVDVIEDYNSSERHIGLVRPMIDGGPHLQSWTLQTFLERVGILDEEAFRPSWRDRLRLARSEPQTFVYIHRDPDPGYRSVLLETYELRRTRNGLEEPEARYVQASPRALIDLWIASDPRVQDSLKEPAWSEEAWTALYKSGAERMKPH